MERKEEETNEREDASEPSSSAVTETAQRPGEDNPIGDSGPSTSQEESLSSGEEIDAHGFKQTLEAIASSTRALEESVDIDAHVNSDLGYGGRDNVPAFVTARSLVAENLLPQDVFLSPGFRFRSAAAMAGWDDEALLMATEEGDPCLNLVINEDKRGASLEAKSPEFLEKSPQMNIIREIREKKREERTPQLAATPLSAGRRHRRARRQTIHGCSPEALPIGDLSLKEEFQNGVSQKSKEELAPKSTGDQRQQDAASSSSGNAAAQSEATNQKPACLDQLREELSCAICLDICFKPSTTSCGHSFCRGCMESVLQKCGLRCPKCRQTLKGDTWRNCPVNIVLWNTIQLLFPAEVALKGEVAAVAEKMEVVLENEGSTRNASRGHLEPASMTTTSTWQHARPPSAGLRRRGRGRRVVMTNDRRVEEGLAPSRSVEGEPTTGALDAIQQRQELARQRQELADAAFARQLQMQLMNRNVGANNIRRSSSATPDLASAAANLRAMANRTVRNRARH